MDNSTLENLLTRNCSFPSQFRNLQEQTMEALHIPVDEVPGMKQVMEKLDEVKFSPRESTLRAIFHHSDHKEEEIVH
jgi:hypothetical protein